MPIRRKPFIGKPLKILFFLLIPSIFACSEEQAPAAKATVSSQAVTKSQPVEEKQSEKPAVKSDSACSNQEDWGVWLADAAKLANGELSAPDAVHKQYERGAVLAREAGCKLLADAFDNFNTAMPPDKQRVMGELVEAMPSCSCLSGQLK